MPIRIYDRKFREQPGRYFLQSGLAVLAIVLLMGFHLLVESPALLAALGASSFIAFTMPHARISTPRHLIGGYLCGATVGGLCQALLLSGWIDPGTIDLYVARIILAGLAVGVSILLMVVLDFEHAPAASIALGLVLERHIPGNVIYVMAAIIVLATVKHLLKRYMMDLI